MQQLHLVGFTTDLDGLIFSARRDAKSGGFLVALDDRFLSQIKEAIRLQSGIDLDEEIEEEAAAEGSTRRRRGRLPRQVHSALAPRDIQARLRAGRTVEEVAAEAGVDDDWVMRFATPVLAEQTRVIDRALGLFCRTSRKGESSQPLGVAVAWNLVDKGLRLAPDELSAGWSAYHLRDTAWILRFRYISRNRAQVAQWECDPAAGTLVALNRLASEIGYVEAGRRHRPPSVRDAIAAAQSPPRPAPEPAAPVRRPAVKKATARRAGAKKAVATKTVAKKVVAKKAVAKKPVAKKPVAKKAVAKKAVAKKAVAKKAVAKKAVAKKAPRRGPVSAKTGARPRSPNRASGRGLRRHPDPAGVPRARVAVPPALRPARPLRPLGVSSNGPVAAEAPAPSPPVTPDPPAQSSAPVARQRPLVAIRRIDSRQRSFPPPPAQRVIRPAPSTPVERERPDADPDPDEAVVVIQARRASD